MINNTKARTYLLFGTILVILCATMLLSSCSFFVSEEYITTSTSPQGTYTLEAYRVNGGATSAFSVKVYLLDNNRKKMIYNEYREDMANIVWQSDSEVSINGKQLNLSLGETYDFRLNP